MKTNDEKRSNNNLSLSKSSEPSQSNNVIIGRGHHAINMVSHQATTPPWYYSVLINILAPLYRIKVWQSSRNNQNYQQEIDDRFGKRYLGSNNWNSTVETKQQKLKNSTIIWCHAVSLGETNTIVPILNRLLNQGFSIWMTNTTQTGYARVQEVFANEITEKKLQHSYMPIDKTSTVKQFLKFVQPDVALFVETELWANTLYQLSKYNKISILVNARLSEQSFQKYLKIAKVSQSMMENLGLIIAQDVQSAKRFRLLGADSSKIRIAGSLKWTVTTHDNSNPLTEVGDAKLPLQITDSTISPSKIIDKESKNNNKQKSSKKQKERVVSDNLSNNENIFDSLKNQTKNRPVWVAASTHLGEESVVLAVHQKLVNKPATKNALLILVPRHPERFEEVENQLQSTGLSYCKRSLLNNDHFSNESDELTQISTIDKNTQVFYADSMGELAQWYSLADIAFVGGSMVNVGGHNPIESLIMRTPVIMGQYTYSLEKIAQELIESGVLLQLKDDYTHVKKQDIEPQYKEKLVKSLFQLVSNGLQNIEMTHMLGQKGYDLVQEKQDIIERQYQTILQIIQAQVALNDHN